MTKKDYVMLAQEIAKARKEYHGGVEDWAVERVLDDLCDNLVIRLKVDNPAFKKDTFLKACGCPI